MKWKVPLSRPDIDRSDRAAVERVLQSTVLSRGPELKRFEAAMQDRCQVTYAVGVSSGTAALEIILKALAIGPGDEVIAPSFTVPATLNAIMNAGASPVLVDIEETGLGLDPAAVKLHLNKRTKAIVVVHAFGMSAAVEALGDLALQHSLHLVEDACEALGTRWKGRQLGTFGIAGAFGFYPNKQITCGEGGMIVTDDPELARACRELRNNGRTMSGAWLDQEKIGLNARLPETAAALGASQLERLDTIVQRRTDIANSYREQLAKLDGIKSYIARPEQEKTSWFALCIELSPARGASTRDALADHLAGVGIQIGKYFAPLHWQPAVKDHLSACAPLPVTERVASNCLVLPLFHQLSASDISYVCEALAASLAQSAGFGT